MSDRLTRYRHVEDPLPSTYLSWDLFGAGLENLGRDGKPVELPLRDPTSDELLLRVDAIGLCFSDAKLIAAGPEHPRIRGRDLQKDPTVPGHEAALTVVKVGSNWKNRFEVGQRFIIQADIFVGGEQKAFGYVQRGALAQFAYAGPMVLAGDDGCYLIPIRETTGYAEAALVEPWACVEAAYHIPYRTRPKPRGRLLIIYASKLSADVCHLYDASESPTLTVVVGEPQTHLAPVLGDVGMIVKGMPTPEKIASIVREETEGEGFDDIFLIGPASSEVIEACDRALAKDGILAMASLLPLPAASIDIGRVHYHGTRHVGTNTPRIIDAYTANVRNELKGGGATWMVGAAGPMGQMHVQRALELDDPPAKLFATDISPERLEYTRQRLQAMADRKKVTLVCRDVRDATGLDDELRAFTDGRGFDDIYVHAPVAKLVEHAAMHLASNAVFNIFAGVPLGTMARLPMDIFTQKHCRMIGSSGSSLQVFLNVLQKCEERKLATRMSLAALGSIETGAEGIRGVKEGRFPGKTVLFPHIRPLELIEPKNLSKVCPEAAAYLEAGSIWTNEAERAFLNAMLR